MQSNMLAVQGTNSTDARRESVLKGVGAQQQVAAAAQQTTTTVVAANNIRATSAVQTDKQIAESSGFSSKRVQENFRKIPQ